MRQELIDSFVPSLARSLGARPPVPAAELRRLHKARDYDNLLRRIRDHLRIDVRLRLGLVNRGGPSNAMGWVVFPRPMPPYGSREFRTLEVTVHLRRQFLAEASFESVVATVAHEFVHVLLWSIGHPLKESEEATDLACMILGYGDYLLAERTTLQRVARPASSLPEHLAQFFRGVQYEVVQTSKPGYLTEAEAAYAFGVIRRHVLQRNS